MPQASKLWPKSKLLYWPSLHSGRKVITDQDMKRVGDSCRAG